MKTISIRAAEENAKLLPSTVPTNDLLGQKHQILKSKDITLGM
jgi:hypothetical protein